MKKSQVVGVIFLLVAGFGLFDSQVMSSASSIGGLGLLAFFGLLLLGGGWE